MRVAGIHGDYIYTNPASMQDILRQYKDKAVFKSPVIERYELSKKIINENFKSSLATKKEYKDIIENVKRQRGEENQKSDNCFIATAIYGDLNHPKTVDFRSFRHYPVKCVNYF